MVKILNLKPGSKVLDVGCGIGGSAFYMVKNFQVNVIAVDLSTNMLEIAKERAKEFEGEKVQFVLCDVTTVEYEPESFDVIYSRDTILHIQDKEHLFKNFLKWLKPGGELLITDYCCSPGEHSERFKAYVAQRHYHLLSVENYGKLLEKVGFLDVRAEDRTKQFVEVLATEKARLESTRSEFLKEFSEDDLDSLIQGWSDKLVRCGDGDQKWGLFFAKKPSL